MNGKSVYAVVPPPAPSLRSVQDEWGMFDPNQAGLKAAFRAARALTKPLDDGSAESAIDVTVLEMMSAPAPERDPAPVLAPAPAVHVAAATLVDASTAPSPAHAETPAVREVAAPVRDNLYHLTERQPAPHPVAVERGAVYTLEFPTRCPQCSAEMGTVRVSRLLRTQVSFTSTLPRKGYIIVCPHCDGILSAELSGLI